MAITLLPADTEVVTGGTAITSIPADAAGGIIQNPYDAQDQNISPADPEILYVDPINAPGSTPGAGNGTCFALYPGQTWEVIAGQDTPTRVNAATSGHKFSGIYWNQG